MRVLLLVLVGAASAHAETPRAAPDSPTPAATLDLAFVGDIMFGRYKGEGFQPVYAEKHDLFAAIRDDLVADLTMANLETPVMRRPPERSIYGDRMRFVAPPERVRTLLGAGIRYVTVANNHAEDMRQDGLVETPQVLAELGITAIGTATAEAPAIRPETIVVKGRRLGFVAATAVRNGPPRDGPLIPHAEPRDFEAAVTPAIIAARKNHDLVIVVVHWGVEYRDLPSRWQIRAAHAFVDAGADFVIGHHPHVLQPIERYKQGLIAYSLGNFVFDNLSDNVRRTGVLRLRYSFTDKCLDAEFRPAVVRGKPGYRPTPDTGWLGREIARKMQTLSAGKPHHTKLVRKGTKLSLSVGCAR